MLGLSRDEISGGEDDGGSLGAGPTDGGVFERPSNAVLYTLGDEPAWVLKFSSTATKCSRLGLH